MRLHLQDIGTAAITALLLPPMVILQRLLQVHAPLPVPMALLTPLLLQRVKQYVPLMHHQILLR